VSRLLHDEQLKLRTTEECSGLRHYILNVYRRLFRLGCDVAACRNDDKRVRLTVRIFQVKPPEEYGGRCDDSLSQLEFLSQFRDHFLAKVS